MEPLECKSDYAPKIIDGRRICDKMHANFQYVLKVVKVHSFLNHCTGIE